jgi:hypothetical protein
MAHTEEAPSALAKRIPKWPMPPLDGQLEGEEIGGRRGLGKNVHADDAHFLARADAVADERGVGGQPCAEHRRDQLRREGVGDRKGEVLVRADVRRVAAVGERPVRIEGVVCV